MPGLEDQLGAAPRAPLVAKGAPLRRPNLRVGAEAERRQRRRPPLAERADDGRRRLVAEEARGEVDSLQLRLAAAAGGGEEQRGDGVAALVA